MTGAVNNLAGSLAGSQPAAQHAVRDLRRKAHETARRRQIKDGFEQIIVEVEAAEKLRALKDNTQEETREDREQAGLYGRDGAEAHDHDAPPHLDLRA